MNKCPVCAADIQDREIKCNCDELPGSSSQPQAPNKWYHTNTAVVIALATLGPFALPLVWKNPSYKAVTRIVITAVVIILTVALCWLAWVMCAYLIGQIKTLMEF